VIYKDGTTLTIDFSEIESFHFRSRSSLRRRKLWQKIIDPFGRIDDYALLTPRRWFSDVVLNVLPPYSFGFGSAEGEIHIVLAEGKRLMRLLIPWWNTAFRSKDLSLLPFDAREFYGQLDVAISRWQKGGRE
jgi:hypothetical protein